MVRDSQITNAIKTTILIMDKPTERKIIQKFGNRCLFGKLIFFVDLFSCFGGLLHLRGRGKRGGTLRRPFWLDRGKLPRTSEFVGNPAVIFWSNFGHKSLPWQACWDRWRSSSRRAWSPCPASYPPHPTRGTSPHGTQSSSASQSPAICIFAQLKLDIWGQYLYFAFNKILGRLPSRGDYLTFTFQEWFWNLPSRGGHQEIASLWYLWQLGPCRYTWATKAWYLKSKYLSPKYFYRWPLFFKSKYLSARYCLWRDIHLRRRWLPEVDFQRKICAPHQRSEDERLKQKESQQMETWIAKNKPKILKMKGWNKKNGDKQKPE